MLVSCGTGIEITEHVTDKDVKKAIILTDNTIVKSSLQAYVDSVPNWQAGKKRFWVADDQARLLFQETDSVALAGHVLEYDGYDTGRIYDNRQTVNLNFRDTANGRVFVYRSGKTIGEFTSKFSIPMLIDLDVVDHVARQVVGNNYYILTGIWYHPESEHMINGRHFILVHIDSVLPGNAVMPLRAHFTTADSGEQAMVWMSDNSSTLHSRDFDALFSSANPRLSYPTISDRNWELITRAALAEGMTKEECRLSMGSPKNINQLPDQSGMKEYWYYDGGAYLYFVDGLLNQYRK